MHDTNITKQDLIRSLSTKLFPRTVGEVLDWSDWLWIHCGTYSQALKNAVRYFLGDITIDITDEDHSGAEERDQIRKDLFKSYKLFALLGQAGDEYIQWGNSFCTVAPAVRRLLTCRKCRATTPAKGVTRLRFTRDSFTGVCPFCNNQGTMDNTEEIDDSKPLQVSFWNPRLIDIDYCPTTRECEYYLRPSKEWKAAFGAQSPMFVADTRLEFLQAMAGGRNIKMDGEYFKHLKPPLPSTIADSLQGWGLPLYLSEFSKVVEFLMLKRFNEAILSDYLIPFRIFSPPPASGNPSGDSLFTYNMGDFRARVMELIKARRNNPTQIHVSPFPLQYQIAGGEAKALIPTETIDKTVADLLSAMCIPIEFSQMSMANSGGPPVGLRRFEKVWGTHITALDEFTQWLCDCRTSLLRTPAVECQLVRSSIYDDDMSRDLKAKLGMANVISKGTAFGPLGLNYKSELLLRRDEDMHEQTLAEEQAITNEKRVELQGAMAEPQPGVAGLMQAQAAAMGGGQGPAPAAGGMPPGGGGTPSVGGADIEQLWAEAEQVAQQIMVLPASERRSQLINLSKKNPQLHAFVKSMIEKIEQQAGQQGVQAAREGQL